MQEQQKQKLINEIITFVSGTPEELQRVSLALQDDSVSQLQDTVNRAYAASARRAHVELTLVQNGLANTPENWSIVRNHPSLSSANYTLENFRYLVETNPGFKASLKWDAEPFAAVIRQEKKQASSHQAKVEIFNTAARVLTGRGVKNVAANEANFRLIQEALEEDGRDFTMDNVIDLIVRGNLGLASNDADVAQDLAKQNRAQIISTIEHYLRLDPSFPQSAPDSFRIRQWIMNTSIPLADVRERVELAEELTNSYGPGSKPDQFRSFMLSVSTTEQLRQRAAEIQERQRLRSMSKAELRQLSQSQLTFHGHMTTTSTLPPVPPEITAQAIRTATVDQQKKWHKQYGVEAISARVEGRA